MAVDFTGSGSKDVSSKMPKEMKAPSKSSGGPVQMAGFGDKDTSGTITPKGGKSVPSGGDVAMTGFGNKDLK